MEDVLKIIFYCLATETPAKAELFKKLKII